MMKKIITVLAIALVIISCKKSEEEIDKSGEIITLPHSQNGEDITLNGVIISFGIPAATEYGFLYAAVSTTNPLAFNTDDITLPEGITNVSNPYPTDKYSIKHTTKLMPKDYKYRAYIRNSDKARYGDIVKFTVNGPHKKAPEIIPISYKNDSIITFKGRVLDTIINDSIIKEVGFVITLNPQAKN